MNTLMKLKEGKTQQELADLLCVSQPTICYWMSGKTLPRRPHLQRIAKVAGVPVATVVAEFFK